MRESSESTGSVSAPIHAGSGWIVCGALLAGLAVAAGALAAHGLDGAFTRKYAGETRVVAGQTVPRAVKYLADFRTAAEYQMYHALGLVAVGLAVDRRGPSYALSVAGRAFLAGIVLFSGSLYLLTLSGAAWLGAITPIGGVAFLIGWGALAVGVRR